MTDTATSNDENSLTFEALLNTYEKLKQALEPMWYAMNEHVPRNEIYVLEKTDEHPRVIVFHPVDYREIDTKMRWLGYRLEDYSGYKPTEAEKQALRDNLAKTLDKARADLLRSSER